MIEHFSQLFNYDSDINTRVLKRLREMPTVPVRMRDVYCHILAAKHVWMLRLRGDHTSDTEIWPELSWTECERLVEQNRSDYARYLADKLQSELSTEITYQNSKGVEYRSRVQDILQHVLLHSAYHRGQVAQSMRKEGTEPVVTDYIFYIRDRTEPA